MEKFVQKISLREHIFTIALIFAGNIILAFGMMTFVVPSGFITGGATGLGLLISHATPLPLETGVTIINVIMFIIGFLALGKKFAATTLLSTFLYPAALGILRRIPALDTLHQDPVVSAIFGGALIGIGVGLVIRVGASTGGMDIPPIIINRRTGASVAYVMNIFDMIILALQLPFSSPQAVLYSILAVFSTTLVMDKVVLLGVSQTQVLIISQKYEEINEAIQEQISRGTTFLEAISGRLKDPQKVIMSVISNRQLKDMTRLVKQIDPHAFIVINRVNEVHGNGFTINLDDQPMKLRS